MRPILSFNWFPHTSALIKFKVSYHIDDLNVSLIICVEETVMAFVYARAKLEKLQLHSSL